MGNERITMVSCFQVNINFAEDDINRVLQEIYKEFGNRDVSIDNIALTPIPNHAQLIVVLITYSVTDCDKILTRERTLDDIARDNEGS